MLTSKITVLISLPLIKEWKVEVTKSSIGGRHHISILDEPFTRVLTSDFSFSVTNKEIKQIANNEPLWVFILNLTNSQTRLNEISIIPFSLFKMTLTKSSITLTPKQIRRYIPALMKYLKGGEKLPHFNSLTYISSSLVDEYYKSYKNKYLFNPLKR